MTLDTLAETLSGTHALPVAARLYAHDGSSYRRLLCDSDGRIETKPSVNQNTGNASGTTTDTDVVVADIDLRNYRGVTLFVKNTGATNNMDVTITSLVDYDGQIEYPEQSWSGVTPGTANKFNVENVQRVKVSVKSSTAGNATDYRVEWLRYG